MSYTKKIAANLAKKMKFDIWGADDIEQEIYFLLLQAQPVYDPNKGDEFTFYFNFVKNRLKTFKRDNYSKNTYKMAISDAASLEYDIVQEFHNYLDGYLDVIDENIMAHVRADYLRFKEGVKIPYRNKDIVVQHIRDIIKRVESENG